MACPPEPDIPPGVDFTGWQFRASELYETDEGDLVFGESYYVGRFYVTDVLPAPKTCAMAPVVITLADIRNNAAEIRTLVAVKCEVAVAALRDLLKQHGMTI